MMSHDGPLDQLPDLPWPEPKANPAIEAYAPTVDTFLPCIPADEKRLRCGILYLRDRATAAMAVASWEASQALAPIASLASVHAYGPMTQEQLRTLRASLTRMMMVAQALETRGPKGSFNGG